mmetsp:Transcript_43391/g.107224  ORF Transcript_43391/g.107224 Transcript_43391/m.107224 type:complete len:224 (+) Transcript_43391:1122-1793(+)
MRLSSRMCSSLSRSMRADSSASAASCRLSVAALRRSTSSRSATAAGPDVPPPSAPGASTSAARFFAWPASARRSRSIVSFCACSSACRACSSRTALPGSHTSLMLCPTRCQPTVPRCAELRVAPSRAAAFSRRQSRRSHTTACSRLRCSSPFMRASSALKGSTESSAWRACRCAAESASLSRRTSASSASGSVCTLECRGGGEKARCPPAPPPPSGVAIVEVA